MMHSAQTDFVDGVGDTALKYSQTITADFIEHIQAGRDVSGTAAMGDYHAVCTVPAAVFEIWQRQGRDPWRMTAKEQLALLRRDGLDAFIQTNRAI